MTFFFIDGTFRDDEGDTAGWDCLNTITSRKKTLIDPMTEVGNNFV